MDRSYPNQLVLIGPAWPLRGGISLFTVRLAEAFSERGVHVKVISFSRLYPVSLFPGQSQETPETKSSVGDRILDSCIPITWIRAARRIRAWSPDVVIMTWWHIWFWPCYRYIAWALRSAGFPVFLLCHNCWPHENGPGKHWLTRNLLRNSDGLLFLSRFAQKCWPESDPPSIALFHPFYEWPEWPLHPLGSWSGRILWAGYGRSYKGLDMALGLLDHDRHLRLTVAGDFYDKKLLAQVKTGQIKYGERLKLHLRFCTDAELVELVDQHDILICPYKNVSQSGMAAFALGRGRPVVATPVGGLPEQIGPNVGVVAERVSIEALLEAISAVYSHPPRYWTSGIQSMRETWSWRRLTDKLCVSLEALQQPGNQKEPKCTK